MKKLLILILLFFSAIGFGCRGRRYKTHHHYHAPPRRGYRRAPRRAPRPAPRRPGKPGRRGRRGRRGR